MTQDNLVHYEHFDVSRQIPGVVEITITTRPLGIFGTPARQELTDFLRALPADPTARAAILTGSGSSFSVGSNIRAFEPDPAWLQDAFLVETTLNETIETCPIPTIAACNGHTLGGGAVMALACDMRIAARSATFGFPEVKLGAMATATGTQSLPRLVGRGQALRLLLSGRIIDAEEAYRIGLVEELADDADLLRQARALATEIATVSPAAVKATKQAVTAGLRAGYAAGRAMEEELTTPLGLTRDASEGKAAFLEKRPPRFG